MDTICAKMFRGSWGHAMGNSLLNLVIKVIGNKVRAIFNIVVKIQSGAEQLLGLKSKFAVLVAWGSFKKMLSPTNLQRIVKIKQQSPN